jgi:hypothetical protein
MSGCYYSMRFCTQCGASLDPDEQFCWQCGFRQPEQVTAPAQFPSPAIPQPPFPPPGSQVPPVPVVSGIVLTPKIITGIVAAFIIISAVLFFMLPAQPSPAGSPSGSDLDGTVPASSGADQPGIPGVSSTERTPEETSRTQTGTATQGCPQGFVLCNGLCRDVTTDEQNCGGCGIGCTAYQVCSGGRCTTVAGTAGVASFMAPTQATTPPATSTTSPAVATPLPTTAGCPAEKTLCNGVCTDLLTSNGNCGSCNYRCTEGQKCEGGRCVLSYCLKPLTLCNGVCKNLYTDMSNCGSCGKVCPSPVSHGTVSCQNGACTVTCEKDYGNCDGIITNGCESYLRFDANNCGSCGIKCPSGYVCDADTSGCHPRIIK